MDIDNTDFKAFNNKGICQIKLKDYKGALESFNKAIELEPYCYQSYNGRAVAKVYLDNLEGAIEDYSKVIEICKEKGQDIDIEIYADRARAKHNLGDYNGAIEDYNKAIELDPNDNELIKDRNHSISWKIKTDNFNLK